MTLIFYLFISFVLISGVIRGIKYTKRQNDKFHLGKLTAMFSALGIAACLSSIIIAVYTIATFDERIASPQIITQISIQSGFAMFVCFILSFIGNVLLLFYRKGTEQGAAANP